MTGHFGFLETNFQNLIARISNEISVLSGTVAISVLLLCVFVTINHFRSKKILEKATLPITDVSGEPRAGASGFLPVQCPCGSSKSFLPAPDRMASRCAPLQTILTKLIDAGIPDAEIPKRLQDAAAELATLRSRLVNWPDEGPDHAQIRTETLALVDQGDFETASEMLRRGRETGWTFPMATCREEAEYHAREAMIDHLQLRFCAAADSYAAAAAWSRTAAAPMPGAF